MTQVNNIMEILIEEQLDLCIEETGVCSCEQCRADIKALALNHIPPRYSANPEGSAYVRADFLKKQAQADILAAITEAIEVVKANPRHK